MKQACVKIAPSVVFVVFTVVSFMLYKPLAAQTGESDFCIGVSFGEQWDRQFPIPTQYPLSIVEHSQALADILVDNKKVAFIAQNIPAMAGPISVDYRLEDITAQLDVDLASQNGTILFSSNPYGVTTAIQIATIIIFNDNLVEGDETFRVVLTNPKMFVESQGYVTVPFCSRDGVSMETVIVTITDDGLSPNPLHHVYMPSIRVK